MLKQNIMFFYYVVVKNFVLGSKKLCFRLFLVVKNFVLGSASPAVVRLV